MELLLASLITSSIYYGICLRRVYKVKLFAKPILAKILKAMIAYNITMYVSINTIEARFC